ncbi:LapA family protein [Amphibacillus cookii]|uniref:LapA family protein n=1 Tax=Amphibacillus cookii TaxID=767787 RepID=UPI001958BBEF|nr:lipopolysaccharide assembly protein LapA domain-containing protein [Amphibacillus cookii]MBM7541738.1 putative integral membrane protein [Amphibacillus cookii]
MKGQTYIISALVFALIVAIFAVINVEPVEVNYLFTTAESPLILIILVSTLLGGLITGGFSIYHLIGIRKSVRQLEAENESLKNKLSIDDEQEGIEVDPKVTESDPVS